MSKVSIIGAYNTKFGNFVNAGIDAADVDALWVASCAPGIFANQEHIAALGVEIAPAALRFKPMTRVEDACASGSVALFSALYAVESGRAKVALVIGVEKMNLLDTKGVTHGLATCSYWAEEGARGMTFPGLFAEYAKGYAARYRLDEATLARMLATVAALNYKNGLDNPLAHFGKGGPSDRLGLSDAEAILALPPRPAAGEESPHSPAPAPPRLFPGDRRGRRPGHRRRGLQSRQGRTGRADRRHRTRQRADRHLRQTQYA